MTPNHIGELFGNYRLLHLLGEGGFAQVYLGEHIHLGTQAAVKVLTTQLTDNEITQFRNEARTIISMDHPNIVRVLDFGMQGAIPFIVMVYAPRGSLRALYPKQSRLPLPQIVLYINQVASALQYIHDRKLIHRDVKPENMLVSQDGAIALSDFGIAVIAHSERSMSQRDLGGTAVYMAPEQFQGKPRPASDQYSLGIVVYEWLCGAPPFHGGIVQLAYQHSYTSPQPLREKMIISPRVEDVILKALAKESQHRFPKVQDFAFALEQAIHAEAHPPQHGSRLSFPMAGPSTLSTIANHSPQQPFVISSTLVEQKTLSSPASSGFLSDQTPSTVVPSPSTLFPSHQISFHQPLAPAEPTLSSPLGSVPLYQPPGLPPLAYPRVPFPRKNRWLRIFPLFLVSAMVLVLCGVFFLGIGDALVTYFNPLGACGGITTTADRFMCDLKTQGYNQAYNGLDAQITILLNLDDFTRQAQEDDRCYGPVTGYSKVPNSEVTQGDNQSVAYMLFRSKLTKPYKLELMLSKDASGNWLITSYGNDLGPAPPTCA